MSAYETEEQQVEALKKWWNENGKSLIAGVVIGIGGIVGWQGWQGHQKTEAEAASVAFDAFRTALGRVDGASSQGERLIEEYPGSTYAVLTAMALSSYSAEKADLDGAQRHLQWVIDHSDQAAFIDLAQSRLARIYLEKGEPDAALSLLGDKSPVGFESIYSELRGDALLQKGDASGAANAYDEALATIEEGNLYRDDLQMKRDDLGS